jgi:hypothetical protein
MIKAAVVLTKRFAAGRLLFPGGLLLVYNAPISRNKGIASFR